MKYLIYQGEMVAHRLAMEAIRKGGVHCDSTLFFLAETAADRIEKELNERLGLLKECRAGGGVAVEFSLRELGVDPGGVVMVVCADEYIREGAVDKEAAKKLINVETESKEALSSFFENSDRGEVDFVVRVKLSEGYASAHIVSYEAGYHNMAELTKRPSCLREEDRFVLGRWEAI